MTFPEAVSNLLLCPKRKLPIPFSAHTNDDGTGDFTNTSHERSVLCAEKRLCGVCGDPLGYWIAFLGGALSADPVHGAYLDPPMHEVCAEAAIQLCPYIGRQKVPRRNSPVEISGSVTPPGFIDDKSADWVMVITRSYRTITQPTEDGYSALMYRPAPAKRTRRFTYQDGKLTEI